MKKWTLFFLVLVSTALHSYQVAPWFGGSWLIQIEPSIMVERFYHVDTHGDNDDDFLEEENKTHHLKGINCFQDIAIECAPTREWSVEMSFGCGNTKLKDWGYDHFLLCGRYLLFSDPLGDPFSLSVGLCLQHNGTRAAKDILSSHQGKIECSVHAAIGKEWSCEAFWRYRIYAALGIGQADIGSPWVWAKGALETNWWDSESAGFQWAADVGFGHHNLNPFHAFRGYGSIAYQKVQVGLYYKKAIDLGELLLEYSYQPYARNCPKAVQRAQFTWLVPFAI